MTAFEKWQVLISCLQTGLLLITFLGALYLGMKQNEINQNLLDLNFSPSLEVAYTANQFQIYNRGKDNIWLYGNRVNNGPADVQTTGRMIAPGGYYYIPGSEFAILASSMAQKDGEARIPMELYVEASNGRRYTVNNEVYCETKGGTVLIHNQTTGLVPGDWAKKP